MALKRKFEDEELPIEDCRTGLSSLISNYESAEAALLWLLNAYRFDRNVLRKSVRDKRAEPNFYNVNFEDMAEFVELNPRLELDDIGTFNLHRSRIPTDLFRSIVEDWMFYWFNMVHCPPTVMRRQHPVFSLRFLTA